MCAIMFDLHTIVKITSVNADVDVRITRRVLSHDDLQTLLRATAYGPTRYGRTGNERVLIGRLALATATSGAVSVVAPQVARRGPETANPGKARHIATAGIVIDSRNMKASEKALKQGVWHTLAISGKARQTGEGGIR